MANSRREGGKGQGTGRPKLHTSHRDDTIRAEAGAPRVSRPRPARKKTAEPRARRPAHKPGAHKPGLARTEAGEPLSAASEASRSLAITIAIAALEKKAAGLEILDVAGKVDYADFLVVMTGRSDRHVQSLAQSIEEELRKKGVRALAVEGMPLATWVLMDFGDVVVHVFQEDARTLYDIEGLWLDAGRVPLPPGTEAGPTS